MNDSRLGSVAQELDTLGLSFLAQNCEQLLQVLSDKHRHDNRSPEPQGAHG